MKKCCVKFSLLLGMLLFVAACKKGAEDPKISFSSRKSRVAGDWRMTGGTASITSLKPGSGYSTLLKFNGSAYERNETPTGGTLYVYSGFYTLNISFKKDGSFVLTESYNARNLVATGTWNFTSGVGKFKNKECVALSIGSVTGDQTDGHIFNKFSTEFIYKIIALREHEMKIECSSPVYLNGNGEKLTVQCSYSFSS